jgi:hypothetical protein
MYQISHVVTLIVLSIASLSVAVAQGPGSIEPPHVPKNDAVEVAYGGTVTEITKNSITIQWIATKGEKPKTFAVSETLAAGKIPMEPRLRPGQTSGNTVRPWCMYRLTDVKVGDTVDILYAHLSGADICDHICIKKRPGGRVPPLPEEAEKLRNRVEIWKAENPGEALPPWLRDYKHIRCDEWFNAYWDLEDKGIPYPEKFGADRRWPIAPMPRLTSVTTPRTDN